MTLAIGDRFAMNADAEVYPLVDEKTGEHIANFLPGYNYRVTERNIEVATLLVTNGQAVVMVQPVAGKGPLAAEAEASGKVSVAR